MSALIERTAPVELSAIDHERFGVVTGRADGVSADNLRQILDDAGSLHVDLLIARCPADDLAAVQAMETAGLKLMDAQMRFAAVISPPVIRSAELNAVRTMLPGEEAFVVRTARLAFSGYAGHYHADPRLPRELCDEVYASWAGRCCSGEAADHIVIAEVGGEAAGFSAFQSVQDEARLVLGAVAPWARGHGLYAAMAVAGMEWANDMGLLRMTAVTQVTNLAAQRSWISAGMRPEATWYTFHGWLESSRQA